MFKTRVKFKKNFDPEIEIAKALDKDLGYTAALFETEIKNLTPVRTSRLKSSFEAERKGLLEYQVGTNVDYAPHVEYGTVHMQPFAMMRNAAKIMEQKSTKILKAVFKRLQ